jgi:hypothetical protein
MEQHVLMVLTAGFALVLLDILAKTVPLTLMTVLLAHVATVLPVKMGLVRTTVLVLLVTSVLTVRLTRMIVLLVLVRMVLPVETV